MPSLKETGEQLTGKLEDLVGTLREELTSGDGDFEKLSEIADQISEQADGLAETFNSIQQTLVERVQGVTGDGGGSRSSSRKKSGSGSKSGGGDD